jgi:TRAP-type mannitol/chloroaromatic compound transport system permease small subunit
MARPISVLLRFAGLIDRLTDWLGRSLKYWVLITIAVGFFNVVARYVGRLLGLQLSSNGLLELQWYLFSITFFLGFAYILKHNINVRVDFLYGQWPLRSRLWIDLMGTLLFLIPFCLLGLWATWGPVLQSWGLQPDGSWGTWEISADANGLPRAPVKSLILVAFSLLLLQAIAQAVKYLAIIRGQATVEILGQATEPLPFE